MAGLDKRVGSYAQALEADGRDDIAGGRLWPVRYS